MFFPTYSPSDHSGLISGLKSFTFSPYNHLCAQNYGRYLYIVRRSLTITHVSYHFNQNCHTISTQIFINNQLICMVIGHRAQSAIT